MLESLATTTTSQGPPGLLSPLGSSSSQMVEESGEEGGDLEEATPSGLGKPGLCLLALASEQTQS